jgi:hypothetical protein
VRGWVHVGLLLVLCISSVHGHVSAVLCYRVGSGLSPHTCWCSYLSLQCFGAVLLLVVVGAAGGKAHQGLLGTITMCCYNPQNQLCV